MVSLLNILYKSHILKSQLKPKMTKKKQKVKIREITITSEKGAFSIFKRSGTSRKDYDFEGILALRQLLNNEKARILHVIKTQKPVSIYDLAKKLNRGFKSV